jgi:hypothetical protein
MPCWRALFQKDSNIPPWGIIIFSPHFAHNLQIIQTMSADSYEILYYPFWGRIDVSKMILELFNAKYEHVVVGQVIQKKTLLIVFPTHPPAGLGKLETRTKIRTSPQAHHQESRWYHQSEHSLYPYHHST